MNVLLGLTGRIKERLKTLNKQRWAVVWQTVAHKPVRVFLAAAVISAPCLAETPAVNGAKKVATELVSSGKVPGKDLDQSAVQPMAAKPLENGRVNSGAEGGGSSSEADFVSVAPSKVSGEAGQKNSANNGVRVGEEGFDPLYLWLIVIMAMLPIWVGMSSQNPCPPEFVAAVRKIMKTPNA